MKGMIDIFNKSMIDMKKSKDVFQTHISFCLISWLLT